MTWFRLDDNGSFHAKVVDAGNEAWGAFCRAGQWCAKHLTDGTIPTSVALLIAPKRVWKRLGDVGLVEKSSADSLQLHDYLQWNLSAADVAAELERKRKNIRDFRGRRKRPQNQPVTEGVTGYVNGNAPAGNHGPDPDPDPKREERDGTPVRVSTDPEVQAIHDRIRRWPIFASLNAGRLAEEQGGWMLSKGQKLDWVLAAVDECATKCPDGATYEAKHRTLVGFMHHARRPAKAADGAAVRPKPIAINDDDPVLVEHLRKQTEDRARRIADRIDREKKVNGGEKEPG